MAIVGANGEGTVGAGNNLLPDQRAIIDFYELNSQWKDRHPRAFQHPVMATYGENPAEYTRNWIIAEKERLDIVIADMEQQMQTHGIPVP